jgi:hypothetical protein
MSRPRFLADHDLNEHIIDGVLRREPLVEFVRARDVDMDDKSDGEVLAFASGQGLLVVSHDVNTMPSHANARMASGQAVAGVVMVQQSKPIAAVIENLVLIWSASEAEEWRDQVVFLPW